MAKQSVVPTKQPPLCGALKLREARAYIGGVSVPTMHRLIARGLIRPNKALRKAAKLRIGE